MVPRWMICLAVFISRLILQCTTAMAEFLSKFVYGNELYHGGLCNNFFNKWHYNVFMMSLHYNDTRFEIWSSSSWRSNNHFIPPEVKIYQVSTSSSQAYSYCLNHGVHSVDFSDLRGHECLVGVKKLRRVVTNKHLAWEIGWKSPRKLTHLGLFTLRSHHSRSQQFTDTLHA